MIHWLFPGIKSHLLAEYGVPLFGTTLRNYSENAFTALTSAEKPLAHLNAPVGVESMDRVASNSTNTKAAAG